MFTSLLDPQTAAEMRSLPVPLRWLGMFLALVAGVASRWSRTP
jgi:hypothetical protein